MGKAGANLGTTEPTEENGPPTTQRSMSVLHSPDLERVNQTFPVRGKISLGRSGGEGLDVPIDDKLLSRKHATIALEKGHYVIEDHDSRNGSFVNGKRIRGQQRLHGDCIVRLGVSVFELSREADLDNVDRVEVGSEHEPLLGRSTAFRQLMRDVDSVTHTSSALLISGEVGTGRALAAQRIHHVTRDDEPFVIVQCGGLPAQVASATLFGRTSGTPHPDERPDVGESGLFGEAASGILLLSGVEQLSGEVQQMVREALVERAFTPVGGTKPQPLDARVMSTTTVNLQGMTELGEFDSRLYELLSEQRLDVPSLRSRRCDVPVLLRHYLSTAEPAPTFDWSATCIEKMLLYDWPMNISELRDVARRFTRLTEDVTTLRSAHLPKEIRRRSRQVTEDTLRASAVTVQTVPSRKELVAMLTKFEGSLALLSSHYAKSPLHVTRWLKRHDLNASDFDQ